MLSRPTRAMDCTKRPSVSLAQIVVRPTRATASPSYGQLRPNHSTNAQLRQQQQRQEVERRRREVERREREWLDMLREQQRMAIAPRAPCR